MADHVRDAITSLSPKGRVVDLFSGMGSVAESLQDTASVVTNDALSFTAALSRARFTGATRRVPHSATLARLSPLFEQQRRALEQRHAEQLRSESAALADGRSELSRYMEHAQHVANSPVHRRRADYAASASGSDHYELATLYFSAGYLSLRQAIEADALRYAIDTVVDPADRDWVTAAWIAATSVLVNAPGHTAQYLRPNSESAFKRMRRTWARSVWEELPRALRALDQVGTENWRANNGVYIGDALELVLPGRLSDIGAIYADPPYTKDQYSRYYHVYETLYRYDYPDSRGLGRSRSDRFSTGFSLKSAVVSSFHDLCRNVARMNVPLVISYPEQGLLTTAGGDAHAIAALYFRDVSTISISANHSTLGASNGDSKKTATENLHVCLD